MNKATLIRQVNERVQAGDTGDALTVLWKYLDRHQRKAPELYDEIIQLMAIYKRANRKASMNLISEEVAAQELEDVNAEIGTILRKVDQAFKEEEQLLAPVPSNNRNLVYGLGLGLLALLAVATFSLMPSSIAPKAAFCPDFNSQSHWQTLIVPYQYATDATNEIKAKLDSVSRAVAFNAACEVANINFNNADYPNTLQKAKAIGENCQTDLIFWRNTSESINKTRYHFVDLGDNFQFNLLSPSPMADIAIDSIIVETSIPTSSELSGKEDATIYSLLLGIGANRSGEHLMAIRILEKISDTIELKTDFALLKQLHLADSYRLMNRKEKAIEAYSNILNNYDGYTLASLNRGVLYWSLNNHKRAIKDFDTVLKSDSTNLVALYAYGRTCLDLGITDEAIKRLQQAAALVGQNNSEGLISYTKQVIDITLRNATRQQTEFRKGLNEDIKQLGKRANPKVINKAARYYLQIGEPHKAVELLFRLGPGELEANTKARIRDRLLVQSDENFRVDLESFILD